MKQRRTLFIAIGAGVISSLCICLFMLQTQAQAENARNEALSRYGGEQVEVCVAARDISAGERLGYDAVETRMWVAGLLPEDAVQDSGDVVGQLVSSPILKGEVIVAKRFQANHEGYEIPAGKQAVSVPVKAVQAVGGSIQPGMIVSVYSSGDTSTSILASNVLVLDTSVGDGSTLSTNEQGWITLAIDAVRVQEVIAASNKTTLYFVIPGNDLKGESENG